MMHKILTLRWIPLMRLNALKTDSKDEDFIGIYPVLFTSFFFSCFLCLNQMFVFFLQYM